MYENEDIILGKLRTNREQLENMAHKVFDDFLFVTAARTVWGGVSVSGGLGASTTCEANHPGVGVYSSHASNANSGYRFATDSVSIQLIGGEKTTIVFKTAPTQGSGTSGILRRVGFHNAYDHIAPVHGAYCKMADDTGKHYLMGHTVNNSTISATATKYELASNTWYRLVIEVDADASRVDFTLYADNSETVLWADYLTTNIPTAALSHRDICTLTSSTGAITIGYIDYMDIVLPNTRRV